MMKEWTTVISWQQGVALLHCETHAGCGSCHSRSTCGIPLFNKLGPETQHQLQVKVDQPLQPGQRVEIGISEGSLLRSAMLVYLSPLLGLMLGGGVMQWLFSVDWLALSGAVVGGVTGFLLAKLRAARWGEQQAYQPIVLQIGLPPDLLRQQ